MSVDQKTAFRRAVVRLIADLKDGGIRYKEQSKNRRRIIDYLARKGQVILTPIGSGDWLVEKK